MRSHPKLVSVASAKKRMLATLSMIVFFIFLAGCDFFGGDDSPAPPSFQELALAQTSTARETLTAAPRETWTAQARQTLTALPANETATGAAMSATETRAAAATEQLFTREAQTVAANLTGTRIALARGTPTPTQTLTRTPTASPTPPEVAQVPQKAVTDPLSYVKAAEDAKWRVAWVSQTRGQDWAGKEISQTVHYDGANYYGGTGEGAEAWVFAGEAYYFRQNGQARKGDASFAAQVLDQIKNGWQSGINQATLKCDIGTFQNKSAVACSYERTSKFRNEDTLNRLIVYIDPKTNLPLAVTNTFNPINNPNATGSGTTSYTYTKPPPIVPPQ